ncbi:MAG: flagellar hook-associated protein FlgL, partial [candidate division Zixibacteria bacterium]|nr:flagellar hook-associated protein FlgL [candidate division Zixibacteria bacterium]
MRISNRMLTDRVLFNMQRSLARFLELQTKLSSGRRINRPSDDPTGTLQDLGYRTELSRISHYRSNIDTGLNWQQTYDAVLADLKDMIVGAKEVAVSMANDSWDGDDGQVRMAQAGEIESIIEQVMQLANNELGNKSIFAGFKTDGAALQRGGMGAVYMGDDGLIEFQIDSSSRIAANLVGADVFLKQLRTLGEEADLNMAVTGDTLLGDLNGGAGIDLATGTFNIIDRNLGATAAIDLTALTPANTVNDLITAVNGQLLAVGPDPITDVTVSIGGANNHLFFDTTASGIITTATSLGVLNDGYGVNLDPDSIVLSDGGAINITVDLSGSTTVGDIITKFNAQAPAGVTMQVDPVGGKGLEIIDANGPPLNLTISEANYGTAGHDLGILGDIGAGVIGQDLNPIVSFKIEETTGTTAADLGIVGEFFNDFAGTDINPRMSLTALVTDFNGGLGLDLGELVIWQGDTYRNIDLSDPAIVDVQDLLDTFNNCGLDITASLNADETGIQIVNNDRYRSLTIEGVDGNNLAKRMGIFGSSDMAGSLSVLVNALRNNDRDGIGLLIGNMDEAIQHLVG